MYISHSSKIPGQPRDELQWEEEEEINHLFVYLTEGLCKKIRSYISKE